MSLNDIAELVKVSRQLAGCFASALRSRTPCGHALRQLHEIMGGAFTHALDRTAFADSCAQAVVNGLTLIAHTDSRIWQGGAANALAAGSDPLCATLLATCFFTCGFRTEPSHDGETLARPIATYLSRQMPGAIDRLIQSAKMSQSSRCYEQFLAVHNRLERKTRGVYYTPAPLAEFIVRAADEYLRKEFRLPGGLADTTYDSRRESADLSRASSLIPLAQPVRILDPAAGTGAFLLAAIDVVCRRWQEHTAIALRPDQRDELWNEFVSRHLLPRLWGLELMLPAAVVAHLRLAIKLSETGYRFQRPQWLHLFVADTLTDPPATGPTAVGRSDQRATTARDGVRLHWPATVILGNPPFSGISINHGRWIDGLLRGTGAAGEQGYYHLDGQPLRERKHWLQDDYVKFFRYAQWRIRAAGCGFLGYVSSHGYLDNVTFRAMRHQLLESFPNVTLIDLHGNHKRDASVLDESPFQVAQGVAIGLFRRPPGVAAGPSRVRHASLRGSREAKLNELSRRSAPGSGGPHELPSAAVEATAPFYLFVPRAGRGLSEYECADALTDVMPVHCTAPVTARDHLVIAFDEQELRQRLQRFRDLSLSDEHIRQIHFPNPRSARYPPGDTRGWKLGEARQRMAADEHWQRYIRPCLYRPFDTRSIYYAPWMIDWPRPQLTRHLLDRNNVALIARRQMVPDQPCHYFWATSELALDGVIRSDNRGSESLFPLYLHRSDETTPLEDEVQVNLAPAFLAKLRSVTRQENVRRPSAQSCSAPQAFHYIYALFHAPAYRQRYAEALRVDYPRVLIPNQPALFYKLSTLGSRLIAWHTGNRARQLPAKFPCLQGDAEAVSVAGGYPRFDQGRVWINSRAWFGPVARRVWRFQIGSHQVCRKWLKDRRGRLLSAADVDHYCFIVGAIDQTCRLMRRIDAAVERHGGWPAAFAARL